MRKLDIFFSIVLLTLAAMLSVSGQAAAATKASATVDLLSDQKASQQPKFSLAATLLAEASDLGGALTILSAANNASQTALAQEIQEKLAHLGLKGVVLSTSVSNIRIEMLAQIPAGETVICFSQACSGLDVEPVRLVLGGGPYDNQAIQMAVLYGGDWDTLMTAAGVVQYLPVEWWGNRLITNDARMWTYDPELARALLAEGGYPYGFAFTLLHAADEPLQAVLAEDIQAQLELLDLDVTIQVAPGTEIKAQMTTIIAADDPVLCLSSQCKNLHEVYLPLIVK